MTAEPAHGSALDALLEASWPGRRRTIRGRELAIELVVTGGFLIAAMTLAVAGAGVRRGR